MKHLNQCLLMCTFILVSSCSSILKTSAVHDKMASQIEKDYYPYSVQDLETKLGQHLESTKIFGNKMIILSNPDASSNLSRQQSIKEEMEEGFTYKDRLYTSTVDVDFSWLTTDTAKLKDKVLKAKFHVLEHSADGFLIVKGDSIYEAKKADAQKTSLRVYKLTNVYRPLTFNVDWWNVIRGKGMLGNFASAPVDLIKSRQYQQRSGMEELAVFFAIDEARATKLEEEISATL